MNSKIKIFGQKFAHLAVLRDNFWPFWGRKSRILNFFRVVWELFRKCLGIVFGLKMPTFECILSSKGP